MKLPDTWKITMAELPQVVFQINVDWSDIRWRIKAATLLLQLAAWIMGGRVEEIKERRD